MENRNVLIARVDIARKQISVKNDTFILKGEKCRVSKVDIFDSRATAQILNKRGQIIPINASFLNLLFSESEDQSFEIEK